MNKIFRFALVLVGTSAIIYALGFFMQASWATVIWPIKSARLSNIFVSSILAAIGAPIVWIGLANETRAMTGGALNLLVTGAGIAASTFTFNSHNLQPAFLLFGIGASLLVIVCVGLIFYSQHKPFLDTRPIPRIVRLSFLVFAIALLLTAISLLAQRPNTFPWPLLAENSVMYGWIFLGAMCFFLYGVLYPVWSNARGQMIGFLAYDLVLIVPFLIHFQDVQPVMLTSLIIYTLVVSYSGLLAAYYLFIHPATRFSFARQARITNGRFEKPTSN